jgi:Caspase domain
MLRFLLMVLLIITAEATVSAKRVALIIGNGVYANATTLKNPPSDAKLVAASLRQAGFDDVQIKTDLGKTALEAALRAFGERAEGADVALLYYAGHGIEAGGQNYLIPTDARLLRDRDLDVEATRLDTALLMAEGARLRVIILDACRNNPFTASMQRSVASRAVGRGLAQIEPSGETLVVYAAKAGSTAADGEGANSPFAQALAKRLPEPGLEISLLFRAVRDDVLAKTGRTQEPFTYGSLSGQAFYFKPAVATTTIATSTPASVPTVSSETTEVLFWQGAVSANSEAAYRSYLTRYPQGLFAGLADENLKRMVSPAVPQVSGPQGRQRPRLTPQDSGAPVGTRAMPSFKCGARLNRVERMICNAPALANADRKFALQFTESLGAKRGSDRAELIFWAAENRKLRDQCPTQGCVLEWYTKMTRDLGAF